MPDIQTIAASLSALATPSMKPKELITAVCELHPDASKKQVVRAAFYVVIMQANADPERARQIQDAALKTRLADDTVIEKAKKRGKKGKREDAKKV